jgi:cell shape-determining protein MreC
MSDYTEYMEYYKKTWEQNLAENKREIDQLKEENARLKKALNKIFSLTHKWVVTKNNAEEVLSIVKPIRQVCDEALKGGE